MRTSLSPQEREEWSESERYWPSEEHTDDEPAHKCMAEPLEGRPRVEEVAEVLWDDLH